MVLRLLLFLILMVPVSPPPPIDRALPVEPPPACSGVCIYFPMMMVQCPDDVCIGEDEKR